MNEDGLNFPVKQQNQIAILPDSLNGYTQKLFRSFREIFDASSQRERVVFWIEQNRGYTILRCVRKLQRQYASEDILIGRTKGDLNDIRAMIGNFASNCNMTPIRWELYADFNLVNMVEVGRFDHFDLLPFFKGEDDLAQRGIVLSGDWDFDNVILMHKCPNCGSTFNKYSIIYIIDECCEKCGKIPDIMQAKKVMRQILARYKARLDMIPVHPREVNQTGEFPIHSFVDPASNSVMYWLLSSCLTTNITDIDSIFGSELFHVAQIMYQSSLFKLLTVSIINDDFRNYVKEITDEEWSGVIDALVNFGSIFVECDAKGFYKNYNEAQVKNLKEFLPDFLGEIILGHYKKSKTIKTI